MPSLDIVSELDLQEVDNAINQAKKEVTGRYDFRGSKAEYEWDKESLKIKAEDDYKLGAMKDLLLKKLHSRGIDIRAMAFEDPEAIGGMMFRQKVNLVQGISREVAKKINKDIKDMGKKVQSQIQDEKIRLSSKSIDELRAVMTDLKSREYEVPLQFDNMRS